MSWEYLKENKLMNAIISKKSTNLIYPNSSHDLSEL